MAKWYVRTGTQLNLTFPGIVFGRTTTKLGLKLGLKRNNPQNPCAKAKPTSCCHAAQPQLVMAKRYVRTGTQLNLTFPGIVFGRTTTKLGLKLGSKRNNPQNAMPKGKTNIMLSCCTASASNGEVVRPHRDSAEPNVSWHRLRPRRPLSTLRQLCSFESAAWTCITPRGQTLLRRAAPDYRWPQAQQ